MKNVATTRKLARVRRKKHIRKRITGTPDRPRLTVFRSLKGIYAQLVDDTNNKTLLTVSSLSKSIRDQVGKSKDKVEAAKIIGLEIGKESQKMKIKQVVFDRNGYLYHGRVKAVADGAREAGLKF